MSDGTVIWQAVPPAAETGSLQVRQLTPEGLAALRDQLLGMGLLTESATYELEQRPDAPQAPGHGVLVYFFTSGLGDGEDPARITSVQWLGDEEEETYYQPSPERRALDELATSLRDPESLVDADAWEGPPQPYAAADYQLVLTPQRDVPPFDTTDASEIPWPFDEPLDAFGEEVGIGPPVSRCGVMGSEQAAPIVEALADHGFGEVGLDRVTIGSLDWAEGSGIVEVFLLPVMPDGYPACAEQVDY
jgi:hypothetical protein